MRIISPGIDFYAARIQEGDPFTLIRYGDGDLQHIVPDLPPTFRGGRAYGGPSRRATVIWSQEDHRLAFRQTFLERYDSPRYWMALWYARYFDRQGYAQIADAWLDEVGLGDVEFHDGSIWRSATRKGKMYPLLKAIREQPLPIVVIAPEEMEDIRGRLPVTKFITSPFPNDLEDVDVFVEEVLDLDQPVFLIMCAAVAGKMAIHRLFPTIGEESFLVDFGGALHGLCGRYVRGVYGPKMMLSPRELRLNWEGA